MNGRDMMPACARIAAADPAMADRMWNTTTDGLATVCWTGS